MKKSFRDLRKKLSLKAQKQPAEKTTDMISAMPLQELRPYCLSKYKKTVDPVMRQVHKAGEKTFVDYAGATMEWIDTTTGEIHKAQIFVGALGASHYIYCEATKTQTLPDWIASHVHMWEYFGGVSEMVVPDNLKSGVTNPHRYDTDVNANYQRFSEHYGFAIVPARVVRPKDKAKVENAVGIITQQIQELIIPPFDCSEKT